jgi:peptidyl-prolyl cis-trans isomerase C
MSNLFVYTMNTVKLGRIILHTLILAIIPLLYLPSESHARTDDDGIVARVGAAEITAREFRERFELTPWPGKHKQGFLDVIKEQFLYAMIAERALSFEAEKEGYSMDPGIDMVMSRLERWYAKDKLYSEEVRSAIQITEEDLREEFIRDQTDAYVSFLYFDSPIEAAAVWESIRSGTPFDRIVLEKPDHMIRNHKVEWDTTVPQLLDAVDTLEIGEVSEPISTPYGFYIVRVESRFENPLITEAAFRASEKSLERRLRTRLEKPQAREFVGEAVGNRQLEVYGQGIRLIGQKLEQVLHHKRAHDVSDHYLIIFDDIDFDEMIYALRDDLDVPVARVLREDWSIKETLDRLRMYGVWLEKDPTIPLLPQLRNLLEELAIDEILAQKAIERNYHQLPEVRRELDRWRTHYLAELYKRDLIREIEIEDDELYDYYERNLDNYKRPLLVNIREILLATQAEAQRIMAEIDSGRDFSELARLHSLRGWAALQDGEFGLFPSTLHGDIGRIAATLEIGEIYGPLPVPDGYSVFKLLEKRESETDLNQTFSEVSESIRQILLLGKTAGILSGKINSLLDEYGFSVDYDQLESIDVTPIQMFGIRRFGFGGNYPAVPVLDRQVGWIFERAHEEFILP